jgi:hypothetical protein
MGADNRRHPRRFVRQPAIIVTGEGSILGKCVMLDVSASGAKLRPLMSGALPQEFVLVLSRDGRLRRRCTVAWRSETAVGVHFGPERAA